MPLKPKKKIKTFEHVNTSTHSIENKLHFSHLHRYVSAYESSPQMVEQLKEDLIDALNRATSDTGPIVVDQDGEHFFLVNPNKTFDLCFRWKSYSLFEPEMIDAIDLHVRDEDV